MTYLWHGRVVRIEGDFVKVRVGLKSGRWSRVAIGSDGVVRGRVSAFMYIARDQCPTARMGQVITVSSTSAEVVDRFRRIVGRVERSLA